jgi:hypothetical protein
MKRRNERGVIWPRRKVDIYVRSERFPVWLLALDASFISQVWITGQTSLESFLHERETLGVDLLLVNSALDNIGCQNLCFTASHVPAARAVFLVSGSLAVVLEWDQQVSNPHLLMCDEHIRGRKMRLGGDLWWMLLRHDTFGGVTHFQALLETNIPQYSPERTPL